MNEFTINFTGINGLVEPSFNEVNYNINSDIKPTDSIQVKISEYGMSNTISVLEYMKSWNKLANLNENL